MAVVVFSPEAASLFPAPTAEESNDGTAQVNKSLESSIVSLKVAILLHLFWKISTLSLS